MNVDEVCNSIANASVLLIEYNGYRREVEIHACGINTKNNTVARVFQISGGSQSGKLGWKLMLLFQMRLIEEAKGKSQAPRQGYKKGDGGMVKIFCEV